MSQGKTNKRKGSNAEIYYAKKFRELGFEKCVTARYGSRQHDDSGIDLINLPFNVQVKAGFQRGMNPSKVLLNMKERTLENFMPFSPEIDNVKIIIHKKQVRQGMKRTEFDELVTMSFEDFSKIINKTNYGLNNSKPETSK